MFLWRQSDWIQISLFIWLSKPLCFKTLFFKTLRPTMKFVCLSLLWHKVIVKNQKIILYLAKKTSENFPFPTFGPTSKSSRCFMFFKGIVKEIFSYGLVSTFTQSNNVISGWSAFDLFWMSIVFSLLIFFFWTGSFKVLIEWDDGIW